MSKEFCNFSLFLLRGGGRGNVLLGAKWPTEEENDIAHMNPAGEVAARLRLERCHPTGQGRKMNRKRFLLLGSHPAMHRDYSQLCT